MPFDVGTFHEYGRFANNAGVHSNGLFHVKKNSSESFRIMAKTNFRLLESEVNFLSIELKYSHRFTNICPILCNRMLSQAHGWTRDVSLLHSRWSTDDFMLDSINDQVFGAWNQSK